MRLFVAAIVGCSLFFGCAARTRPSSDYRTLAKEPRRDAQLARARNAEGKALLEERKYAEAERAFKDALRADITYGPAHNNLGKAYYHLSKFYLAAWEFQYAIKLMPQQPEPRNNLGLVFEEVGKLDDAIDHYGKAAALGPDNPNLLGNLVRARVRRGDSGDEIRDLLSKLIVTDSRAAWIEWAKEQLMWTSRGVPRER